MKLNCSQQMMKNALEGVRLGGLQWIPSMLFKDCLERFHQAINGEHHCNTCVKNKGNNTE